MFLNQVVNHAFELPWVGGAPQFYASQLTNSSEVQLDKRWLPGHPERGVIASANAHGDVFVYEGSFGYRATLVAAAAVDNWRLWPDSDVAVNTYSVAHLGPFVVSAANNTINFDEGGGALVATLTAGSYSATTLATEIDTQLTAAGAAGYTITFNEITRRFRIVTDAVLNISWTTSSAAGLLGYTTDDAGDTAYDGDVAVPASVSPPVYRGREGTRQSFSVAARCSVDANLLRVRIVGLDGSYAIAGYFVDGRWQAAAGFTTFQLQTMWKVVGVTFEIPEGIRYFLWQVSNGTAGAQAIDIGRFWLPHPMRQMAGEEARQ